MIIFKIWGWNYLFPSYLVVD